MANRPAPALGLREGDREELVRLTRSPSVRSGLAQRSRILLLAADGESNTSIAEKVGVSRVTVVGWRSRYRDKGLPGLDDDPRSGGAAHGRAPGSRGGDPGTAAAQVR